MCAGKIKGGSRSRSRSPRNSPFRFPSPSVFMDEPMRRSSRISARMSNQVEEYKKKRAERQKEREKEEAEYSRHEMESDGSSTDEGEEFRRSLYDPSPKRKSPSPRRSARTRTPRSIQRYENLIAAERLRMQLRGIRGGSLRAGSVRPHPCNYKSICPLSPEGTGMHEWVMWYPGSYTCARGCGCYFDDR